MENTTVMNNEVVETVVDEIQAPCAIDEISKHNVTDYVKYLVGYCNSNFKTIDENEEGFRKDLDIIFDSIHPVEIDNAILDVKKLQKEVKTLKLGVGAGLILAGVGCVGAGLYFLKSKKAKKNEPQVVEAEIVEE